MEIVSTGGVNLWVKSSRASARARVCVCVCVCVRVCVLRLTNTVAE